MAADTDARALKFKLAAVHRSIDHLPIDALPSLSLITGPNGCGKTHFLEAIQGGMISIQGISQDQVQYYTSQSFGPRDNSIGGRSGSQRPGQWAALHSNIGRLSAQPKPNTPNRTLRQLIDLWHAEPDQRSQIDSEIRRNSMAATQNTPPRVQELLSSFEAETGIPRLCITQGQFYERFPLLVSDTELFQGSVAELFAAYIAALEQNDLVELRARRGGKEAPLSSGQFRKKYGPPPWEVVNKVLAEARLDYTIDEPSEDPERPVSAVLRKSSIKSDLSFGSLSSGEKILMSLALCMFFLKDARQPVKVPSVLLFDEVDAFLHPEMTQSFINVVNNILVGEYQRRVIIVTHSPSTVALAPAGSVFVMDGTTRNIRPTTADEGIAALTVGVPTLSIRVENRRQVVVESDNDVSLWERCYRHARVALLPGISLSFIASGAPSHAGCVRVKECVKGLRAGGNRTVAGIVDWDLTNDPDDALFVIGHGKRYSIENYLLDPILLAALLVRDKIVSKSECGLTETETFIDLRSMDSTRLQTIADTVLGRLGYKDSDRETCTYVNGRQIQIPKVFLRTKGHDLEERVREVFPPLRRFSQEPLLKLEILDKVVDDLRGLLPADMVEILKNIQRL